MPLDSDIVHFPAGSTATHRVLFMELNVQSDRLGNFKVPIIYVFSENAAFCAERLLPNHARLSHVIHVRYGGGLGGGGSSTGAWMLNVLQDLGCEVFVTDGRHAPQSGDQRVYEKFPKLKDPDDTPNFKLIGTIPGKGWSNYGDVSWNLLL